jgi:hypothetical protein
MGKPSQVEYMYFPDTVFNLSYLIAINVSELHHTAKRKIVFQVKVFWVVTSCSVVIG